MVDQINALKAELVAILNTRLGWFAVGCVVGAGGNAKNLFDMIRSVTGF